MRKGLFCLLALVLLCIVGLTGCSLFGEKEEDTSKQTSAEEKPKQKELETEEKSKASNGREEKNELTKEVESSEPSKQRSSSKENLSSTSKDSSEKTETAVSQVDWGSAWTRDIQFDHALLEITQKSGNTFSFKLHATNALDADAVKRGAVNVGEVTGTAKIEGDVATQTVPDPDNGCQVKMTNYTGYIQVEPVTDCSGAAGMRVHFDGKYKKGNIPETGWWKEEGSDDATSDASEEEQPPSDTEEADIEDTPTEAEQALTPEEAEQRVKEFLNLPADTDLSVVYDGDIGGGIYFVRVYKYVTDDPSNPNGYNKFYGNYHVDSKTGDVKDATQEMLNGN